MSEQRQITSVNILLFIGFTLLIFHLCIVFHLIPYEVVWGGLLSGDSEMYTFELIAIFLTLVFLLALIRKRGDLRNLIPERLANTMLWGYLIFFGFNTIGNLLAPTMTEQLLSLVTIAMVGLLWIVLRHKPVSE